MLTRHFIRSSVASLLSISLVSFGWVPGLTSAAAGNESKGSQMAESPAFMPDKSISSAPGEAALDAGFLKPHSIWNVTQPGAEKARLTTSFGAFNGPQKPSAGSPPRQIPTPQPGPGPLTPPMPAQMAERHARGGQFNTTPPPRTTGAPGPNLPNLDDIRRASAEQKPTAKNGATSRPIQPSLPCADCEGGGGGGGYYPPQDPRFSTARTRQVNQTGESGVDLGSQNFNWAMPLLNLPGRAGLDLNLTLVYNSLVWTRDGSYIKFNADLGTPAPGFRLGLPTLQVRYLNSQTNIYAYMLVTAAGARIEMRQVSTSVYEAADGTYTQLTEYHNPDSWVVRTSDGTQLTFAATNDITTLGYRCTQIKDRNGNFITATYDMATGRTQTIVDTLGRVITFNYGTQSGNLDSITQNWAGGSHEWARFEYAQVLVAPNFGGGLLVNGPNNQNATVLTKVILQGLDYYIFDYNDAFGQVKKINHYAPDGHRLAYTSYNVNSAAGQTECPRFTERRDWAEIWNGNWGGQPQPNEEAVTSYAVAGDNSWTKVTFPDGTVYKEYFATTGWQTGLTTVTKNFANAAEEAADTPRKWTTIAWTQDDVGLAYQKNLRVTETNIYDSSGNRRRTTMEYNSGYGLPTHIREYGGSNGDQLLRLNVTSYKMDADFINRRIIGLPYERLVYDGPTGNVMSRSIYHYDWGYPYFNALAPSTNYDGQNYPPSFIVGRGNLVAIRRYDCTNATTAYDDNLAMWVQLTGYYQPGSVAWLQDGRDHRTSFFYDDSFSDGNNSRGTFAYPRMVRNPDGYDSLTTYNFDFGAVTWQQTPSPNAGQTAPTVSYTYDSYGRILQITNNVDTGYVRWSYPANWRDIYTFTIFEAAQGETWALNARDGMGRTWATAADLPNATGIFKIQWQVYDKMGRMIQQTNPAETDGGWVPVAEDSGGWVWTVQAYDWKGRPTVTTNSDGTTRENTYGGCGCAGGEVVTARDEAGRRRRMTMDVVGRLSKVEELKYDQTIYSTTTYSYSVLDQVLTINHAGQIRTFDYDGHGRLWHRTTPEQGTCTYTYWEDDQLKTMTDARGAKSTFDYNGRHLLTSIVYDLSGVLPGQNVAATPNVSYTYDAAGNRTLMNDGLGSVSYAYNQLSRLTSETRTFTGFGVPYTLSYQYNLAGELTSITNPFQVTVGYSYDRIGRPVSVSGSGYFGISSYISSIQYRAFGPKQLFRELKTLLQ